MERTLLLLKPDAVQRALVGRIISRVEDKGLKIVALRMLSVSRETASRMYAEHEGKDFHEPLMEFICSGPVVAMVVEGLEAIATVRRLVGDTNAREAPPGSVRGDFGMSRRHNLCHGSDSAESAGREIALFFAPGDIVDYEQTLDGWTYGRLDDGTRT
ncbi:MAG: nucleoside-diphosphate kinase [Phycisphaerae bacterium]